jgi:hypothetical protein
MKAMTGSPSSRVLGSQGWDDGLKLANREIDAAKGDGFKASRGWMLRGLLEMDAGSMDRAVQAFMESDRQARNSDDRARRYAAISALCQGVAEARRGNGNRAIDIWTKWAGYGRWPRQDDEEEEALAYMGALLALRAGDASDGKAGDLGWRLALACRTAPKSFWFHNQGNPGFWPFDWRKVLRLEESDLECAELARPSGDAERFAAWYELVAAGHRAGTTRGREVASLASMVLGGLGSRDVDFRAACLRASLEVGRSAGSPDGWGLACMAAESIGGRLRAAREVAALLPCLEAQFSLGRQAVVLGGRLRAALAAAELGARSIESGNLVVARQWLEEGRRLALSTPEEQAKLVVKECESALRVVGIPPE